MSRQLIRPIVAVAVIVLSGIGGCTNGGLDDDPGRVANLEGLIDQADLVVIAEATGEVSGYPAEDPPISLSTLQIVEVIRGDDPGPVIILHQLGHVDDDGDGSAPAPLVEATQRYLAVLEDIVVRPQNVAEPISAWAVTGGALFSIDGDRATLLTGDDLPSRISVDSFG